MGREREKRKKWKNSDIVGRDTTDKSEGDRFFVVVVCDEIYYICFDENNDE